MVVDYGSGGVYSSPSALARVGESDGLPAEVRDKRFLSQNFLDRLKEEKVRKQLACKQEKSQKAELEKLASNEKKNDWRGLKRWASLEYFLRKKFDYNDKIGGLMRLSDGDLQSVKKTAWRASLRRAVFYSVPTASSAVAGIALLAMSGILDAMVFGFLPMAGFSFPFLRHVGFLRSGYYWFKCYCKNCIETRGTEECWCHNNDM